jgi:hypothetical protein
MDVPYVVANLALTVGAFAGSAWCWRSCSRMVSTLRSWRSVAAEQAEIRDQLGKVEALLKKISQRDVMRDRRERAASGDATDELPSVGATASLKDRLRAKAGIRPGAYPRHQS